LAGLTDGFLDNGFPKDVGFGGFVLRGGGSVFAALPFVLLEGVKAFPVFLGSSAFPAFPTVGFLGRGLPWGLLLGALVDFAKRLRLSPALLCSPLTACFFFVADSAAFFAMWLNPSS
jgi:hypothetical protein